MNILTDKKSNPVNMVIGILLLGSAWGLVEVLLGGTLKACGIHARAGILTGAGMFIMGAGLMLFRKPAFPLFAGMAAALHIQMAVPILGCSLMCRANSSLALLLHGAALAGFSSILFRTSMSIKSRAGTGFIAAAASAAVFYYTGMRLAPCPYLLSFNVPGGFALFMIREGMVWSAFSAAALPLGMLTGMNLSERLNALDTDRKALHYAGAAVFFTAVTAVTGAVIAAGL